LAIYVPPLRLERTTTGLEVVQFFFFMVFLRGGLKQKQQAYPAGEATGRATATLLAKPGETY
jgi:hypothetical protein